MKLNQIGRSMVEMLGVLAIIGVLSVGAIAGYSKAMLKYKLNKQAEQLNTVVNMVGRNATAFNDLAKQLTSTQNMLPIYIKMGEVPKEMIKNDDRYIYDVFNTQMDVFLYPADRQYQLLHIFPDLTKKSANNFEICNNILWTLKENSATISHVGLVSNYTIDGAKSDALYGDASCSGKNVCLKNITLENIHTVCTNHVGQKTFWFDVWFRT